MQFVHGRFKLVKTFKEIVLKIEGVNFTELLNELNKQNIKLKQANRVSPTELELVFSAHRHKKIVAILNEKCYTIKEQKTNTYWGELKKIFLRVGILVGLFVGILINILASFFIWDIRFFGQTNFEKEIQNALIQNGVKKGCLKFGLTAQDIEKLIYENIEDVSLCDISFKGTTLLVNYTIRTQSEKEDIVAKNIIAKNDGIIANISVLSGTAMVKVGDYVKKGEVLIAGFTEQDEDVVECEAKGQVYAYSWKSAVVEFPKEKIEWVRTGQSVTNVTTSLFNSVISSTKNLHNFEKTETEQKTVFLTQNQNLPIKVTFETIYELTAQTVTADIKDYQEKLNAQARLLAWEQILGDEDILDEKTETNFVSNIWFVTHYIKIKEKISWKLK